MSIQFRSRIVEEKETTRPCYELLIKDGSYHYTCGLKTLNKCGGYWLPFRSENDNFSCDNPYQPQTPKFENGKFFPEEMNELYFDSLGIKIGDEYKGGIYIGKYNNKSIGFGSIDFQDPEENNFSDIDSNYAIIVHHYDYKASMFGERQKFKNATPPSIDDGFYNCYGNNLFDGFDIQLINAVRGNIISGFADWYIPSIKELYFFAYSLKINPMLEALLNVNYTSLSSSFIETDQNYQLFYSQNMNVIDENFGKTILIPGNIPTYLRLFRKIVLT